MSTHTVGFTRFAIADPMNKTLNDHASAIMTAEYATGKKTKMYCLTQDVSAEVWATKNITGIKFNLYTKSLSLNKSDDIPFWVDESWSSFNPELLTYNNSQTVVNDMVSGRITGTGWASAELQLSSADTATRDACNKLFANGTVFTFAPSVAQTVDVYTPAGAYPPSMTIDIDANTYVLYEGYDWLSQYGGKTKSVVLGASLSLSERIRLSGVCCAPDSLSVTQMRIRWRAKGSTTEHDVAVPTSITSSTAKFTFSTELFGTERSVEVKPVLVTNDSSVWTPDAWLTLNMADTTPTAVPVSPVGEVLDSAAAITFRWNHIVTSGLAQTKAELDYSTDGTTWQSLAVINGAQTSYTAPANTFSIGVNFWRVRTYNADGVASEWSQAVQFICVGAPETPVVLIGSASPRPSITWQVEGQLAYQVELEGVYTSGVCYGTGKQWTAPMYLADGSYTVRVRVQNEYGLWSGWGMAVFGVQNTAGAAITLNVESGASAELWWQTSGAYDFYLVYRDGALIAKTTNRMYTDLTSIGAVSYQVRGCFAEDSNYGLSGAVQTDVNVDFITVIDLERSRTLVLPRSASAHRKTSRSFGRNVKSVQLAGRRFPTLERSEHESRSIRVSCAVATAEERAQIEALIGALVAVKTPEGALVTGCVDSLSANDDGGFYTEYSFTLTQADMEEAVDIDA